MKPYYEHGGITIYHGNCLEVLPEIGPVDAVVTDPPYGLEFMGKEWDKLGRDLPNAETLSNRRGYKDTKITEPDNPGGRHGSRFRGQHRRFRRCTKCNKREWSGSPCRCSDPAWKVETTKGATSSVLLMQEWHYRWAVEALRVAKPGAHLLAFGGTRTFHRLTCAIEDAGFDIRDCVMWLYGSGFPKSLNVSKAIDKAEDYKFQSAVRRAAVDAVEACGLKLPGNSRGDWTTGEHAPGDKWWARFQKWLPGLTDEDREHVEGKIVATIQKTAGWFTSRSIYDVIAPATDEARAWAGWGTALKPAWEPIILARKPLEGTVAENVLKHGVGGLNIDACRVEIDVGDPNRRPNAANHNKTVENEIYGARKSTAEVCTQDQGYHSSKGRWPANLIHDGSEEVMGLFPKTTSGKMQPTHTVAGIEGRTVFGADAKGGFTTMETYGDTGSAARFFYCAKASRQDRRGDNDHPTVKPLALMSYLCRLIAPPGGVVLDPFMGSGPTLRAARDLGCKAVGIEIEERYCEIAAKRLAQGVFAFNTD